MSSRYRVFCDGLLFSDSYIPAPKWHVQEPQLKLADNSAGSFEFALSSDNVAYSKIVRMQSTIVIGDGNSILWSGRVISQSEDFFKRKKYVCEGALAYLNDTYVGIGKEYRDLRDVIKSVIDNHNTKITTGKTGTLNDPVEMVKPSARRQIACIKSYLDISDALATSNDVERVFNNETTFEWLNSNVIEKYKCHARIVYDMTVAQFMTSKNFDPQPRLVIADSYTSTSSQAINFGVNLLDFTKNWDLSNLVTVIIPRGKQLTPPDEEEIDLDANAPETDEIPDDGLSHYLSVKHAITKTTTTTSGGTTHKTYTYYGSEYVYNDSAYNTYGRIEKVVDFSDIEDPTYLLKLARIYVNSLQFNNMVIEIKAVDMHHVDSNITKFKLLDKIHCISKPHGMDTYFPLTEMSLDLENPSNNTYVLGESDVTSLSGVNRSNNKQLAAKFAGYPTPSNMLDVARYEASMLLNNYNIEGYVNIVQESKTSQAIVISNTKDWRQATHLWKWDMNGLGYSPSNVAEAGYGGTQNYYSQSLAGTARWYKTAITANGHIVADFVSTGILSDGAGTNGKNWWNLSTGECRFSAGVIEDTVKLGMVPTKDVIKMANTGYDYSKNNQVGGVNLLDCTDSYDGWVFSPDSSWSRKNGIASCTAPKKASYKTYVQTKKYNTNTKGKQKYTPPTYAALLGSKYTLSFQISTSSNSWGTVSNTNKVVVRICLVDSEGKPAVISKDFKVTPKKSWSKQVIKFTMGTNAELGLSLVKGYTGKLPSQYTTVNGVQKKVYKGSWDSLYLAIVIFNVSLKSIQVRKMQLERGTNATDWKLSKYDEENKSQVKADSAYEKALEKIKEEKKKITSDYKSAVRDSRNGFSKPQMQVINTYTKREAILNKLTGAKNGNEKKGLFVQNGELYMNATFIKTGFIKAGLIKTGILTNLSKVPKDPDKIWSNSRFFFLDMSKGTVKMKNALFRNIEATGSLDSGSSAGLKTVIKNGAINFYRDGKSLVSRITAFQSLWGHSFYFPMGNPTTGYGSIGIGTSKASLTNGLFLNTLGTFVIRAPELYVGDSGGLAGDGDFYRGVTGELDIPYVYNFGSDGTAYTKIATIRIINGIVVKFLPG